MTVQPHQPAADVALPALAAPSPAAAPGVEAMRTWLDLAANSEQLVTPLLGSAFIPASYRTQGRDAAVERANAVGSVLLGLSLGIDPLTALQQIYVVHGRPGMYTKIKVALAQRHGHEVWDEEYSAERVTVCGRRAGWPDERIVRITITIQDAQRAGWTSNDAYRKTPADMLWSRAAARVVDRIASDVLHGIASIEDLDDVDVDDRNAPTPVPSRVTVADLPPAPPATKPQAIERMIDAAAAAGIPVHESTPAPAPEAPAPSAEKLRRELGERWARLKVTGPGQTARRSIIVAYLIGRHVTAAADLTVDELQLLLDNLTAEAVARIEAEVAAEQAPAEAPPAEQPAEEYDPTLADSWGAPALDVPGDQQ